MGFVGSMLDSGNGAGFQAQKAPIIQAATQAQANEQYKKAQDALAQQQQFVQAVQAQNGIQNQSNVFNQLQGVANGTGPNPAQATLANSTGQNISNQAALMAGQRGSAANAGLIARQAAQAGGNLQQQAAGQGAALQANQSLGALNQMGGIAGQQANQQQNAVQGYTNSVNNEQGNILNAINGVNNATVSSYSNMNDVNGRIAQGNQKAQQNMFGNLTGAMGSVMQMIPGMFSGGGGGTVGSGDGTQLMSSAAKFATPAMAAMAEGGEVPAGPRSNFGKYINGIKMAQGGKVPAMVSPGEVYLPPQDVSKVKQGADPIKAGEKIPGTPKHPGNDYRNDIVPKTLEAGGIVIPNAILQSKDPHKKAAEFVAAHLAKNGKLSKKDK